MGDKLGNPRLSGKLDKGRGIPLVDLFGRAAAGISCEKGEGIRSDALGGLARDIRPTPKDGIRF